MKCKSINNNKHKGNIYFLSSQEYSEAENIGKDLTNQPIGNEVRKLWKNKDFKGAFKTLSDHLSKSGQLAEQEQLNEFWTNSTSS